MSKDTVLVRLRDGLFCLGCRNGNAKSFRIRGTAAVGNHPWSLEINSVLRPTPHIQLLVGKLDDITILKILGLILALLLTIGQNVVQGYCPAGAPQRLVM